MPRRDKKKQQEAIETLQEILPPGSHVWTTLRHVSRSGMYRKLSVYSIKPDGDFDEGVWVRWISRLVATALGWRFDDTSGTVCVSGCGMDVGFHLVNSLSYALHGMESKGYAADPKFSNNWIHCPVPGSYVAGYSLHHHWL